MSAGSIGLCDLLLLPDAFLTLRARSFLKPGTEHDSLSQTLRV